MSHDVEKLQIPFIGTSDIPDDPEEQAAAWGSYLHSGQASEAGQQKFSEWLAASAAHPVAYQKIEQWWQDFDYPAAVQDAENENIACLRSSSKKKNICFGLASVAALAASLVIMVAVWKDNFIIQEMAYSSMVGEIRTVSLSDGTTVTLGGDTAMTARISEGSRAVHLQKGRAWFDVAHDAERAFTVQVNATTVKVLGTAFDVNRTAGKVRVSVERGKVEVASRDTTGQRNMVRLLPGDQVTTRQGQLDTVTSFDPARALSWRVGRLEYVDIPLGEVVAEINRYRDEKIIFIDEKLKAMEITMAVAVDETELLLSGLTTMAPIAVKHTTSGIRLERSRSKK